MTGAQGFASALLRAARRFTRDRRGVSAVEFALIAPVLLLLLLGGVTTFLLVRDSRSAERATFTISDILSRASTTSKKDLAASHALFLAMTRHTADDVRFRVTSLKKVEKKGGAKGESEFVIDWPWAQAPQVERKELTTIADKLPLVAVGDSVLVIETSVTSRPLFPSLGFTALTFDFVSTNRPRFVGALPKID